MNKLKLSDNIVRLRHEKKLTQEELADFMGVTKASVSKWEKGINTPDLLLLPQLAAFFDVTIDKLVGYEAQLSVDQIRLRYAALCKDFADLPFAEALEKTRSLAHQYYACYPLLLQLCVLYQNHYMLADSSKERKQLLQEALGWCNRILENCSDTAVCSDALELKAGLCLELGMAEEAIQDLEPFSDPARLAGQKGTLLVRVYQMAGETEKAKSYAQIRQYLDLLNLTGDAILALSLNENDITQCEETMRRIQGIINLYHLETLHPNLAAQFYFQSAAIYALNEKEDEAIGQLYCMEKSVDALLKEEQICLHGDSYFQLLDAWIDRLPLGNMPPRDKRFIRNSLSEALERPAFQNIREKEEFQNILHRLMQKCGPDA